MKAYKSFIITGVPKPLARHRHGFGRAWDDQKQYKLAKRIDLEMQQGDDEFFEGPLHLDIIFYMTIPKLSQRKTAEKIGSYNFIKPDIDNMIKMVCDLANGILYKDDSQISSLVVKKIYDLDPRTEFTIREL